MPIKMDPSRRGFKMFFKPWQITALKYLILVRPEGATSREVHEHVTSHTRISRASIINVLNELVEEDVLTYTEETGKGGHHRVYTIPYDEPELKRYLAKTVLEKLLQEYSKETKNVLKKVR